MSTPRTIHDFGGFPRELYEVRYPAPGAPDVAGRVRQLLAPLHVALDESWGLDHGTWSVLSHAFPSGDIRSQAQDCPRARTTRPEVNNASF